MISVIIRTRNEAKSLKKTLKKLFDQKTEFDFEVIIVDSNSTDRTIDVARDFGCKIVNISPSDFSWGRGLNLGISHSIGEFCILISAHCYPINEKVIDMLVEPLIKNKNVAASYGGQLPIPGIDPFEEIELKLWFPTKKIGNQVAISNSNACIRKEVWYQLKFDETLSSCEDEEWANRVKKAGYSIEYVPEAAVFHSHPVNVAAIYKRWYYRGLNETYMTRRTEKVKLACNLGASFPALLLSSIRYVTWAFLSISHCLKKNYFRQLWKIPFYEFVRMYALYNGIKDCIDDIKNGASPSKRSYFRSTLPSFLKNFKFLAS